MCRKNIFTLRISSLHFFWTSGFLTNCMITQVNALAVVSVEPLNKSVITRSIARSETKFNTCSVCQIMLIGKIQPWEFLYMWTFLYITYENPTSDGNIFFLFTVAVFISNRCGSDVYKYFIPVMQLFSLNFVYSFLFYFFFLVIFWYIVWLQVLFLFDCLNYRKQNQNDPFASYVKLTWYLYKVINQYLRCI